jgi:hypothetical protein
MKMTVITDTKGNVIGTTQGHAKDHAKPSTEGWSAALVAGPGQQLHEVDLPEEVAKLKDSEELHRQVKTYLAKS